MPIQLKINDRLVDLTLRRYGSRCPTHHPEGNGRGHEYSATLARSSEDWDRARLYVEVNACHTLDCPAPRLGKKHGPCTCGADDLFEALMEECGDPVLLPEEEAVCECDRNSEVFYRAAKGEESK